MGDGVVEMSELDEFIAADTESGTVETEVPAETPTETPEQAPETPPAEVTAEQEQATEEAPEGSTTEPEAPVKAEKDTATIPIAALLDEREKRQKGEAALKELQTKFEAATRVDTPAPDVLEDQEAFVSHFKGEMQQMAIQTRIEMSQEMMRMMHPDYDEVESKFVGMAAENPDLAAKLRSATNPAKFAFDTVKNAEKLEKLENVEEFEATTRAEIEAKVRAELEAEYKEQLGDIAGKAGSLSPSLAGERAAGGNKPAPIVISDPLETTFNR
jgi:hypothetical protein